MDGQVGFGAGHRDERIGPGVGRIVAQLDPAKERPGAERPPRIEPKVEATPEIEATTGRVGGEAFPSKPSQHQPTLYEGIEVGARRKMNLGVRGEHVENEVVGRTNIVVWAARAAI